MITSEFLRGWWLICIGLGSTWREHCFCRLACAYLYYFWTMKGMIINKFAFVWLGTYGWRFVSSTFETICINYLGVENKTTGSTLVLSIWICNPFYYLYMLFSAQHVAAGWSVNWFHDCNILGMFQIWSCQCLFSVQFLFSSQWIVLAQIWETGWLALGLNIWGIATQIWLWKP